MKSFSLILFMFFAVQTGNSQTSKGEITSLLARLDYSTMDENNIKVYWKSFIYDGSWENKEIKWSAGSFQVACGELGMVLNDQYERMYVPYASIKMVSVSKTKFQLWLLE